MTKRIVLPIVLAVCIILNVACTSTQIVGTTALGVVGFAAYDTCPPRSPKSSRKKSSVVITPSDTKQTTLSYPPTAQTVSIRTIKPVQQSQPVTNNLFRTHFRDEKSNFEHIFHPGAFQREQPTARVNYYDHVPAYVGTGELHTAIQLFNQFNYNSAYRLLNQIDYKSLPSDEREKTLFYLALISLKQQDKSRARQWFSLLNEENPHILSSSIARNLSPAQINFFKQKKLPYTTTSKGEVK